MSGSEKGAALTRGTRSRRSALRAALVIGVTLLAAATAGAATVGSGPDVTLMGERYFEPACQNVSDGASRGCQRLRFSGAISSRAADEYVALLHQRCGTSGVGTSVVGTQTGEGGFWEATWGLTAGTFRARWMNRAGRIGTSEPITYRTPIKLSLTRLSGFQQHVAVTGDQDMRGRIIELQRHAAGQWQLVRRTRLVGQRGSFGFSSSATFTVREPGLVLRAFVPEKSAAPCYAPTGSDQWTSGAIPGARAGARVIDRTLLCTTAMQGGIRMVSIDASRGSGPDPVLNAASFSVFSGFALPPGLASASTTSFTLFLDRCQGSGAIVSLKPRRLQAAPPGPFGRSFDCEAPGRVYLRVRAVFFEPAPVQASRESGYQTLFAEGRISEAAVAVRTPSGKPLLFATLSGSTARLFAARSCIEDTTSAGLGRS
jgi:hypothetical protein